MKELLEKLEVFVAIHLGKVAAAIVLIIIYRLIIHFHYAIFQKRITPIGNIY